MGKYTADQLRNLAAKGHALPAHPDTSSDTPRFPIDNADDLSRAISRVGGGTQNDADAAKVRRYIISRAKALGKSNMIPDTWNSDGTLSSLGIRTDRVISGSKGGMETR